MSLRATAHEHKPTLTPTNQFFSDHDPKKRFRVLAGQTYFVSWETGTGRKGLGRSVVWDSVRHTITAHAMSSRKHHLVRIDQEFRW